MFCLTLPHIYIELIIRGSFLSRFSLLSSLLLPCAKVEGFYIAEEYFVLALVAAKNPSLVVEETHARV